MPSEPSKQERDKILQATPTALDMLRFMLTIGTDRDFNKKVGTPSPRPKNAAEAQKYAEIRFKAATTILRLRFGTKSRGPMNASVPDEPDDELQKYADMSPSEFREYLDEKIASGELTADEAKEFKKMVRDYRVDKGLTDERDED